MSNTDLLSFVLGKAAFYLDGRLYFDETDSLGLRGTPNLFSIDFPAKEIVLGRYNSRTKLPDVRVPMNTPIVADGDVAVLFGYPRVYSENRLTVTQRHRRMTLESLHLGPRVRMGILDNKIFSDTGGIQYDRDVVDHDTVWKKAPSILPTDVVGPNGDKMSVVQYFNKDVHKSDVLPSNQHVWQRGQLVFYTNETYALPQAVVESTSTKKE
jgi:hypothetical protein